MSIGFMDIVTALLSIIALFGLAMARIARTENRKPSSAWAWAVLFFAVMLRICLGGDGFAWAAFALMRDIGLGLVIASAALWLDRAKPMPFFVPGVALLLAWGGALMVEHSSSAHHPGPGTRDGTNSGERPDEPTTELLLELGPDDSIEELQGILSKYGAHAERAFPNVTLDEDEDLAQVYLVTCPESVSNDLMAALRGDRENVDHLEENARVDLIPNRPGSTRGTSGLSPFSNDPQLAGQWGLYKTNTGAALSLLRQCKPVREAVVAIVDTGVDSQHGDIEKVFGDSPGDHDRNGHGTHCAGLAGAVTNNGLGMASLNWEGNYIRITGYQALSASGRGTIESVSQAIIDAAEDGADVISLSLGGPYSTPPKTEVDAIEYALSLDAIVVAAAGNEDVDARNTSPANIPGVIVVSAVDQNGKKAIFSNVNTSLARPIAAPGVDIISLAPGGDYVSLSGTSMATPMVAGLLGLMRSLDPTLKAEDAYGILVDTGVRVDDSRYVGKVMDAEKALRALGACSNQEPSEEG